MIPYQRDSTPRKKPEDNSPRTGGEATIHLAGQPKKVPLFVLTLPYSGAIFIQAFRHQRLFGAGPVRASETAHRRADLHFTDQIETIQRCHDVTRSEVELNLWVLIKAIQFHSGSDTHADGSGSEACGEGGGEVREREPACDEFGKRGRVMMLGEKLHG